MICEMNSQRIEYVKNGYVLATILFFILNVCHLTQKFNI